MVETRNPPSSSPPGFNFRLTRVHFARESWLKLFFSNVHDFLMERPIKVRPGAATAFRDERFGGGFAENLKEWLRPLPAAARGPARSEMLLAWKPWYRQFWENVRDTIAPRKLPPLKVTSQPVPVPEIWERNEQFKRTQALSFAFHVLVAVLIIVPLLPEFMSPPTQANVLQVTPIDVSPYLSRLPAGDKKSGGGGGGGARDILPASRGRLPKFAMNQITPPLVKPILNPKLPVAPSVIVPPDIHMPNPNLPNAGDPLAKLLNDSNGPGNGAGIGSGSGGGIGSGQGGGVGSGQQWGTGGGYPEAGENGYGEPSCLYCPDAQFSDAAVKLKIEGLVVLDAIITADGRAIDIQVVKGLGYGLDTNAIKAVRNWRFKPAIGPDGRPAAVHTEVEVTFHLY